MSALNLSDALSHYRAAADSTHRFWAYFQLVGGGLISFTWLQALPSVALLLALTAFFFVFAYFNSKLVFESQREAVVTSRGIKLYARLHPDEVPDQFRPFLRRISPRPVGHIQDIYLGLSTVVVVAMWARPFFC
jgi:hypothetical protein